MAVTNSGTATVTLPTDEQSLIIVESERIVSTEVYEGIPDVEEHAALNTLTLTEVDGRTTLTVLVEHPTKEGRDARINAGMEPGMQDALDLLEQVAISLR
jgi:hypothetical protein